MQNQTKDQKNSDTQKPLESCDSQEEKRKQINAWKVNRIKTAQGRGGVSIVFNY